MPLTPGLTVERLLVFVRLGLNFGFEHRTALVCLNVTLKYGRVPVSKGCGFQMVSDDNEKEPTGLLGKLKDMLDSQ